MSTLIKTIAVLVGLLTFATPASASERLVPAVVTHHEFSQTTRGMTFAEVRALYGARAHQLESWYGSVHGHFHVAFKYQASNGTWTDATFVDWTDRGGPLKFVHANWYTKTGVEHK